MAEIDNFPDTIGRLTRGGISDGAVLCVECWDNSKHDPAAYNDIPRGAPVYYTALHPECGDCDTYCRSCAEQISCEERDLLARLEAGYPAEPSNPPQPSTRKD